MCQFAVYHLHVTNGEKAWRLEKRFSDFEELHRQLLYLPTSNDVNYNQVLEKGDFP